MKEALSLQNKKEDPDIAKEMADITIGAGLIALSPEIAKSIYEAISMETGASIGIPAGSDAILGGLEAGVDAAQGFTGIVALSMIMYMGWKKLFKPFSSKKK